MECPFCGLALRIKNSYTVAEGGEAVTVQELFCVNPQCGLKGELPVLQIRHRHPPAGGSDFTVCGCGAVLAKVSGGAYRLSPAADASPDGEGKLALTCRACGGRETLDIAGRRRE